MRGSRNRNAAPLSGNLPIGQQASWGTSSVVNWERRRDILEKRKRLTQNSVVHGASTKKVFQTATSILEHTSVQDTKSIACSGEEPAGIASGARLER